MDVADLPSPTSPGRRKAPRRGAPRAIPRFDSWSGVVWTIAIALDFFWMANPRVLMTFDVSLRYAWITTGVAMLLTITRLRLPRPATTVVAFIGLGYASTLWSIDLFQTFSFTTMYLSIAVIATVIARNADARAIIHGMVLGGLTYFGVSIYAFDHALTAAVGPVGTDAYFAGVGGNRNILSYVLVLAFAFGAGLVPHSLWGRLAWGPAIAALLVGLYLSKSTTGLVTALLLVIVALALLVTDRRRLSGAPARVRRRWLAWVLGAAAVAGVVAGGEFLGTLLGRDTNTLSGRIPLWKAVWSTTSGANRWFGWGWGAVWPHGWAPATPNAEFDEIVARTGFLLNHGHSSFFDLLPEVGLIGVAFYASTYVQALGHAFSERTRGESPSPLRDRLETSRAIILAGIAMLVFGLTEPISTIPLGWFLIVLLATGLTPALQRRPARSRRRAPAPT